MSRGEPRDPDQPRILRTLLGAQVLGSLGTGAATSLGSIIAYQVTSSETLAGISRTVALLSTAGFGIPLALLAVRRGRRPALGLGFGLACLGAVLQVLAIAASNLLVLVAGLMLFGAGQAAGLQARFAATDLERDDRRTRSLALVVWASTVGVVLGPNLVLPGEPIGRALGLPPIAGPYVITAVAMLAASGVIWWALRPDPLVRAGGLGEATRTPSLPLRSVLGRVWADPLPRFAFCATVLNHMVMVVVMTMSAVHLHNHHHELKLIGLTISLHTLGMFAFSPLVGQLAERFGMVRTQLVGQGLNGIALIFCFLAGDSLGMIMAGLFLLGLGWSFGMVSGSALLSRSVDPAVRTQAQGSTDTAMNFCAAFGAAAAGPVMHAFGFAWLSVLSLCCLLPIVWLAARLRLSGADAQRTSATS
ncbi:MFS transporter [Naumannella sp. ID2617S]|uniref:MFS transporter n=1 Tax=Enemella dayhoffiae TaxID=2016507 RepID=UPI001488E3C9|nr:MFS transporter [Enemella dayhoffiae]NNG19110.1 MFS transporter [Naumannella sp. ID2617S]